MKIDPGVHLGKQALELDPLENPPQQPALFDFAQGAFGTVELFPEVWSALEAFTNPEAGVRHSSLDRLLELNAPRLSPLVAYLLATRITDPDISLRSKVVKALGEILSRDERGNLSPEAVKRHLSAYLAQMRTRQVFALLEVAEYDPGLENSIAILFNASPYAGIHLGSILSDRKCPLPLRLQAVRFIGVVGYLDTVPVLERLETRLFSRLSGQQAMPFAPPAATDESDLLPAVQAALSLLRAR